MDFGTLFGKSEQELAAANRRVGDYFLLASGQAPSATDPDAANGGWMVQAMYVSLGKRRDYRSAVRLASTPADALPNARLHVFKSGKTSGLGGAGHAMFTDQPEIFARVVGEFLEKAK